MPIYLITGKLGAGKGVSAVGRMRELMVEGRRVATNIDLRLEHLVGPLAKTPRVIRLPDKPHVEHLEMIGQGNDSYDESKNGAIVLDEMSTILNARNWQDKKQRQLIEWLVHSRKKGWDVYFICQNIVQIDREVREALVEYLVECRRLDRLKIPFVSGVLDTLSFGRLKLKLPKLHVAKVLYGTEFNAPTADRWITRGTDVYEAYDTRQVFAENPDQAPFSYLPPWLTHGRLMPQKVKGAAAQWEEKRRITRLQREGVITFDQWREWMRKV